MRSSAKWTLPVLIVSVACLVGSVSAQKGKPAPAPATRWTLEIRGAGDLNVPTIHGRI
jgi:hypothetical protein